MAIVKFSKSGNQIQFIDDQGNVFGTSWTSILGLKDGKVKSGHTMLMRLPFSVSPLRFGVSPVWNPGNVLLPNSSNSDVSVKDDIFAYQNFKDKDKDKKVNDLKVW